MSGRGRRALFFRGARWRCLLHVRFVCAAAGPNDWGLLPRKPAEVGLSPSTLLPPEWFPSVIPGAHSGHFPCPICFGLGIPNLGQYLVSLKSRASPCPAFRLFGLPILKRLHSPAGLTLLLFPVSSRSL